MRYFPIGPKKSRKYTQNLARPEWRLINSLEGFVHFSRLSQNVHHKRDLELACDLPPSPLLQGKGRLRSWDAGVMLRVAPNSITSYTGQVIP